MLLKSFYLKNYKAFADFKQEFEIKPITILIGKNSAGKSVMTRFPLQIFEAFYGQKTTPLHLKINDVNYGTQFIELVHGKKIGDIQLSFCFIDNDKNEVLIDIEVTPIIKSKSSFIFENYIKTFKIKSNFLNIQIDTELGGKREVNGDYTGFYPIKFNGMLPSLDDKLDLSEKLVCLENKFRSKDLNIDYIGPFRLIPASVHSFNSTKSPTILGNDGQNTYQILGVDELYNDKKIIRNVSKWYKENLGVDIVVKQNGNYFEINVKDNNDIEVNITNVGLGIGQLLPIVTRCFFKNDFTQNLFIFEQPELHLHPAAHGNLAELFAQSYIDNPSFRFIIETHAPSILLRLRALIADPNFPLTAEDFIIYWIDSGNNGSFLKKITVDDYGELSDWPENVFNEDYNEILKLAKAQDKRDEKMEA